MPRKFLCLPEMLGDSSYRTGYFGKWHLGDEFLPQHGFEEWTSIEDSFKSAIRGRRHGGESDYTKFLLSKGYAPDLHNGKCFSLEFPSTLPFGLSKPKFLETKACQFLERHRREPSVLFVAFFEPHPPYNGPFNNEYPLDSVALETTVDRTFDDEMPLRYRLRQEYFRKEFAKPEQLREIKQRYFGLISEIDRSIGAILAKVDDLGLRERTIVALTSDHGDMMSAHGLLGKQLMFEQSAAVPCLVRVPGEMPRRCPQALSHSIFFPLCSIFWTNPGTTNAPAKAGRTGSVAKHQRRRQCFCNGRLTGTICLSKAASSRVTAKFSAVYGNRPAPLSHLTVGNSVCATRTGTSFTAFATIQTSNATFITVAAIRT